jgi:hypothetical protein
MTPLARRSFLADADLWQFLRRVTEGEAIAIEDDQAPPWFEPGVACRISEASYFDFMESFTPRWRHGSVFVVGDGGNAPRLFWRRDGAFFGREFTAEEANEFRRLIETAGNRQ